MRSLLINSETRNREVTGFYLSALKRVNKK